MEDDIKAALDIYRDKGSDVPLAVWPFLGRK